MDVASNTRNFNQSGCIFAVLKLLMTMSVHHKNGTPYPPNNTRATGQKKLNFLPGFCRGWFISTIFHKFWTNGEAQTNSLST